MTARTFWIVAGPNGAGKTTTTRRPSVRKLLGSPELINPDDIAAQMRKVDDSYSLDDANLAAVIEAERRLETALAEGRDVLIETVLSTPKYLRHVQEARQRGFRIHMLYVALNSPELAVERVRLRALSGGHDVPEVRIRERWERSRLNLRTFLPWLDFLLVLDNSDLLSVGVDIPLVPVAIKIQEALVIVDRISIPAITDVLAAPLGHN